MKIKSSSGNFQFIIPQIRKKIPTADFRWALNKNINTFKVLALKKVEWKLKDNKTQEQSEAHKPEGK